MSSYYVAVQTQNIDNYQNLNFIVYNKIVMCTSVYGDHQHLTKLIQHTSRKPLVENELPTLPGQMSSLPLSSGARVTRTLVLCVTVLVVTR